MCDQDHFEDDLHEYKKRGLITRRQFGVLVGAGACMVLPQVANAVAVTESDLTITTPDGAAEAYFVRPATGTAPGVLVWRISSGYARRSGRWASGSPSPATRWWS
jgi:carboxymethylenebutenolidase